MLLAIACLFATTAVFEEEPLRKKEIVMNDEVDERVDIVFDDAIDED